MGRSLKSSIKMSINTEFIEIIGTNGSKKVEALIDTGAEGNYINRRRFNEFEKIGILNFRETYVSLPGSREKQFKPAFIFKEVKIRNAILSEPEFIFVDSIDYDAVIGVEVLQTVGFLIDMKTDRLK